MSSSCNLSDNLYKSVSSLGTYLNFVQVMWAQVRYISHAILPFLLSIVFGHNFQYHLHFCFLSTISNIANIADWCQYFLIENQKDEKCPLLCCLLQFTLFCSSYYHFAEHSRIYLSFTVGLNFEKVVTTFWAPGFALSYWKMDQWLSFLLFLVNL